MIYLLRVFRQACRYYVYYFLDYFIVVGAIAATYDCKNHYVYGHCYTSPTPKERALQQLGLAISNATALHIRDVKDGKLVESTEANDEDLASDTNLTTDLPASQHDE